MALGLQSDSDLATGVGDLKDTELRALGG